MFLAEKHNWEPLFGSWIIHVWERATYGTWRLATLPPVSLSHPDFATFRSWVCWVCVDNKITLPASYLCKCVVMWLDEIYCLCNNVMAAQQVLRSWTGNLEVTGSLFRSVAVLLSTCHAATLYKSFSHMSCMNSGAPICRREMVWDPLGLSPAVTYYWRGSDDLKWAQWQATVYLQ